MNAFENSKNDENDEHALSEICKIRETIQCIVSKYRTPSEFESGSTDVIIDSWMKSGTTLMQNLTYQLLVGTGKVVTDPQGNNFKDISAVVPFIEMGPVCGVYYPIHPYTPNLWKSHGVSDEFINYNKDCRFIYCIRNGLDTSRSFLDFIYGWLVDEFKNNEMKKINFYYHYFMNFFMNHDYNNGKYENVDNKVGEWFTHVKGWLDNGSDIYNKKPKLNNVWFVIYEDLVKDMNKSIRDIAKFLNISVNDKVVEYVANRCNREVMAGDSRFNDIMVSESMGLDTNGGRRVRSEKEIGFKKYKLPHECTSAYDEMFQHVFGFDNYENLTDAIRKRNIRYRQQHNW